MSAAIILERLWTLQRSRIVPKNLLSQIWSAVKTDELDNQKQIDAYYRVQVTPEIQFGPTFQVIFDPVRNLEEDTVYVWGIRARLAL